MLKTSKKNKEINIAFEISPLLLASGSFGDKSGVYRYYYGLIKALGNYIKKNHLKSKIVLFTFNRELIGAPVNKDILDLLNHPAYLFVKDTAIIDRNPSFSLNIIELIFRPFLKIINKIFPVKTLYMNVISELRFQRYISFLKKEFNFRKVSLIYHSETCFYPMKNFKNVITIYDLTPVIMSQYHRFETIDLTQRKLYFTQKHCQGIVCISQSTKNDLLKIYPNLKNRNISICYPGVDPVFSSKHKSLLNDLSQIISSQVNNFKRKHYIFFYSTFEPRKNIINLVQVFYDLHNEKLIPKDFKLVLMGGEGWGKTKKSVVNFVKENYPLKDNNKIVVLDYLGDNYLIDLIKNSYAVIYPSLYEGFGLPVLESMYLGTPVICSNNSSLPEVGGKATLYFDPYDYYDLKNKIEFLVNKPKITKQLSQLGIKQSHKFNWNNSVSKLYHFFEQL